MRARAAPFFTGTTVHVPLATLAAALATVLLAACGSPPTTPAAQAKPTPSPTPTPVSVLAADYKAIVAPSNAAADRLGKIAPTATVADLRPDLLVMQQALTKMSSALVTFQQEVPPSMRPDVQGLRQAVAQELADVTAALATKTNVDFAGALGQLAKDAQADGGRSNLVRSDLGLPPTTAG